MSDTELHLRKSERKESNGSLSNGYSHQSNGVKLKKSGLAINGSVITRRTSVAEMSKKTATHINYCTRRYRLRKVIRSVLFWSFLIVYVIAPIFYWQCTWIRRHIIYLNVAFASPDLTNIDKPVIHANFSCARNLYISPEEGIQLGVWHVMPESLVSSKCESRSPKYLDEREFLDDKPVILHLHGSGGSRGSVNRVKVIKILTNLSVDCHVVTMDYRGFGESTPARTTVESVSRDVQAVYRWLRLDKKVSSERIFFYGQSLGTGIAVHLAYDAQNNLIRMDDGSLAKLGSPAGLVLEAPYTDIVEASRLHPYTYLHAYYPFFECMLVESIRHPDTFWDSKSRIGNVSSSVLILHAEDDVTLPYVLGKRLFEVAKEKRDPIKQPVDMVTYPKSLGYGHRKIYSDPGWPKLITGFIWNIYNKQLENVY